MNHSTACQENARNMNELISSWLAKWPNHCKECGGWGGSSFWHTPGDAAHGQEQLYEPCDHCSNAEMPKCGRCAFPLNMDGQGPCISCGWNYDDGKPEAEGCICYDDFREPFDPLYEDGGKQE